MNDVVSELRTQALESTYSADRRDALEHLAEQYGRANEASQREILQTLADVARDATHSDERDLAREKLDELYQRDKAAAGTVVSTYCWLATKGDHSSEREAAIDRLRQLASAELPSELRTSVHDAFETVIEESAYRAEREKARRGLSELSVLTESTDFDGHDTQSASPGSDRAEGGETYLAVSLAEHLSEARTKSPTDCLQRVKELRDFVSEHPVDDDAYDEILGTLESQTDQLNAIATNQSSLDNERQDRIQQIANRVQRLYLRGQS